jgi:hypothetical protein
LSISIASSTIAMTSSGRSSIMVQGEAQHTPAVQHEQVLPPPVGLEDLSSGVIQPAIDLTYQLELRKIRSA